MDWTKFDLNHLSDMARSLTSSVPAGLHLADIWPLAVLLVVSVFIGLYGERLTQVLILGIFIALGAAAGQQVAAWLALPFWPTVIFVGSLGGIFAYVLYRYALGLVLAVSLALGCGAWSLGTNLDKQEVSDFWANVTATQEARPPVAGSATPAEALKYVQRLQGLLQQVQDLQHTVAGKPEAQKHLVIMMLAGAAVGLLAGLVLGRIAAILWTSLLAGAGVVVALTSLAVLVRPEWREPLSDNPRYVLGAAGGAALLFLLRQAVQQTSSTRAPAPEVAGPSDKS